MTTKITLDFFVVAKWCVIRLVEQIFGFNSWSGKYGRTWGILAGRLRRHLNNSYKFPILNNLCLGFHNIWSGWEAPRKISWHGNKAKARGDGRGGAAKKDVL
jgi:hypothetical protein